MPLAIEVDTERRLIIARVRGVFTYDDISGYQTEVLSKPELHGYDEIFDISEVESIDYKSHKKVGELAERSAALDNSMTGRLAIVAPSYGAFGLARMYQTYRGLQPSSKKKIAVLRSFEEAVKWLIGQRQSVHAVTATNDRTPRWP